MSDARNVSAEPPSEAGVTTAAGDPALRALLAPIFPQIADWDGVAALVARGSLLAEALETSRRAA
jgi:hypothetical protein